MPQFPTPLIEVPTFDLFTDNWGGAILREEQDLTLVCVALLCLGMFLLWFAYAREDSLLGWKDNHEFVCLIDYSIDYSLSCCEVKSICFEKHVGLSLQYDSCKWFIFLVLTQGKQHTIEK